MSEWRGLCNPQRHKALGGELGCSPTYGGCDEWCEEGKPCRCCLAAEVERLTDALDEAEMAREELRKALADRDRRIEAAQALHVPERVVLSDIDGEDIYDVCSGCGVFLDEEDCPTLLALGGTQ